MKPAGLGLGLLAQSETAARTYLTLGGQTQPAWFICDGLEAPIVAVVGKPTATNQVRITPSSLEELLEQGLSNSISLSRTELVAHYSAISYESSTPLVPYLYAHRCPAGF